MRDDLLQKARGRLVFVRVGFAILFLILCVRALEVSLWDSPNIYERTDFTKNKFSRGDIFDTNGVLMATDVLAKSLYADPMLISDKKTTARKLSNIFDDIGYDNVLEKLNSNGRFVWIKRHLTPKEVRAVTLIGEPGLAFRGEAHRFYPQKSLASHVLGYTDIDTNGLSGVELAFNDKLSKGGDVHLTIDVRLQYILKREISNAIDEFSAKDGFGVIMDAKKRSVLAIVSLPDFDPNISGSASKFRLFNRATLGVYELGSLFKIFSIAAFLESGQGTLLSRFDARKPLKYGRFLIRDFHAKNRILNTAEVFIYSSNIGAALMGQKVGADYIKDFYEKLGLLSAPSWPMPDVGRPIIPDPWREINTLTSAYGHGIAVSALQVSLAAAAVLDDGIFRPAVIVEGNKLQNSETRRAVSQKTINSIRQLMRMVVQEGTARKADVAGYRVGGKTGTAEKPSPRGGYDHSRLISSFLGAFPMEDPKYIVLVVVDEPKGTKQSYGYATGGWVAAPAVANIIRGMTSVLGIQAVGGDL